MELIKEAYIKDNLPANWKPYYIFSIQVNNQKVGKIVLRKGTIEERYFDGHIGYSVEKNYRGHGYAYLATVELLRIARKMGFKELIITCSPDNLASKKTILKLPVKYLETVVIPRKYHQNFKQDERIKEVYLIELEKGKIE